MVQILIRMDPTVEQWTIVELQGALETRDEVSLEGKNIGDLHFDSMGVPQLIIGHHLLTGKVVVLDKPYAVMRKVTKGDPMETDQRDTAETKYDVVALVKRKIVFKSRPKPIIIKSEPIRT
ncbi:predicted protein [Nematostella vectensis]|uniref:Chromosome transmission fidelity protein 8 homolog n=1 Tax=Nematostella vectensis TaxID=45351 RepID=A7SUS5_NEMVE|nr:chromosome transmission fidelity protein 8 homolog isoform X1 [Nematostella vectensis]XP_048576804.1 chromosome transmission fidelity protein 8 homolog isoform X2 [Nematostella vectensis]EDO32532.1 predicted protein [Nematostella vectensis]|eukprot:XP_001624632.1 predicted protein [Nematostella vectensis]